MGAKCLKSLVLYIYLNLLKKKLLCLLKNKQLLSVLEIDLIALCNFHQLTAVYTMNGVSRAILVFSRSTAKNKKKVYTMLLDLGNLVTIKINALSHIFGYLQVNLIFI